MAVASLESLPNEIFEHIVQHLTFHDICTIRLTSQSLSSKAVQDTYRSFFLKKQVDLREESLESFVQATTSRNRVGCFVENLSLIGLAYNSESLQRTIENGRPLRKAGSSRFPAPVYTPEELENLTNDLALLKRRRNEDEDLRKEGTDATLLRKAFSNIAASKGSTPLKRLSLRIEIDRGERERKPGYKTSLWRPKQVFDLAAKTFRIVMESLASSKLKVEELDIFFGGSESLQCGLPCDEMARVDFSALKPPLAALKGFWISIADPMIDELEYEHTECEGEEETVVQRPPEQAMLSSLDILSNEKNYTALSSLLQQCPNIESLNIIAYHLDCSPKAIERLITLQKTQRTQHMHHLARTPPLPHLQNLSLADLTLHGTDLLLFLKLHISSLRRVSLNGIEILPEGSFSSIARYLTTSSETNNLETIRFLDNRQGGELDGWVYFRCDSESEMMDLGDRDIVRKRGVEGRGDTDWFSLGEESLDWAQGWEWSVV